MEETKTKKYKMTLKGILAISRIIIEANENEKESKPIHALTQMNDCVLGEEGLMVTCFQSALSNKKYFKEIENGK